MINTIATKAVDQNAEILTELAKKIWEYPDGTCVDGDAYHFSDCAGVETDGL